MNRPRNEHTGHPPTYNSISSPPSCRSSNQVLSYPSCRGSHSPLWHNNKCLTYRPMRYSTNLAPPPHSHYHNGPRIKSRFGTRPLLTPRSSSGTKSFHWINLIHLTKTWTLRTYYSTPTILPGTYNCARPPIHPCRRLRGTKPNSTAKNSSILLYRTPRLNNFSLTIFTHSHTPCTINIPHHNILNIHCV